MKLYYGVRSVNANGEALRASVEEVERSTGRRMTESGGSPRQGGRGSYFAMIKVDFLYLTEICVKYLTDSIFNGFQR